MDKAQIAQLPSVAAILATLAPQDQAVMLDVLSTVSDQTLAQAGMPTQRTDVRRDLGIPAQRFKLWNAYYSVVRFAATVTTNGGNTIVTWQQGTELRPFSYRIQDPLTAAGFPVAFGPNALATQADTNLVKSSETLAGEQVYIYGVSLMPSLTTDSWAFSVLNDVMSVRVSMDGDQRTWRLGRPYMLPASGGLYGLAGSVIAPASLGAWSNGIPDVANYYPFPEPILWTSSGETDSNFNLILRLERGAVVTAPTAATSPTAEGSGIDVGSYVDIMTRLHTSQTGARSLNQ